MLAQIYLKRGAIVPIHAHDSEQMTYVLQGALRALVAGLIPGYSARQTTYDLRRLRRKGLIRRIPHTQRYELTGEGRRLAVFFTKTYTRILTPGLAELDPSLPGPVAQRTPLGRPWREFEQALDRRIADAAIAA